MNKQSRTAVSNHAEGDELPQLIKNMNFLDVFVFAPIWNSHMKFFGHAGDEPPTEYSRHASVHGVSRRQYKLENCIQALMLVTSLLVYIEIILVRKLDRCSSWLLSDTRLECILLTVSGIVKQSKWPLIGK